MKLYALDASAWLRLFLADGPMPRGLEEASTQVDAGNASFVAPDLILVEAAHALVRKQQRRALTQGDLAALWRDMRRTPIDLLGAGDHIDQAMNLADASKISVYDALYLAVSEHVGAPLLTADAVLAKAARALGLLAS